MGHRVAVLKIGQHSSHRAAGYNMYEQVKSGTSTGPKDANAESIAKKLPNAGRMAGGDALDR